ncbi:hypothetical protein HZA85_02580 [Candidatus Uhrbacteria bacterium]|nr:hypothetical protein [Candidatus Uhrbacteria bacterium]
MANPSSSPSTQTPSASSSSGARIFTMPTPYRGGKDVKMVEPEKTRSVATPVVASVPTPAPAVHAAPKIPTKKRTHQALFISIGVVAVALLIGGYLIWRSAQKQTPTQTPTPTPVTEPRPAVQTPEPTSTPTPTPESQPETPFPTQIVAGTDSDSDGLTDVEETAIYHTNPSLPDTDSDGFLDGNEVFHRYNPAGLAPGTLLEAGVVNEFTVPGVFVIAYPLTWTTTPPPDLAFTSQTGESIHVTPVIATDEASGKTQVNEWITAHGGQEKVLSTISKSGYQTYITQDKLSALLLVGQTLVEFKYDLATKTTIDFLQTFQMMLNSVRTPGV